MTKHNRILALDAALIATAGTDVPASLREPIQAWLDSYFIKHPVGDSFGAHLTAQKAAVIELANNPQVFGG